MAAVGKAASKETVLASRRNGGDAPDFCTDKLLGLQLVLPVHVLYSAHSAWMDENSAAE